MSLRLHPVYLLIAGLLLVPHGLFASECVCVKYAMYPYSGSDWMHYAIRTSGECVDQYALPQIQPYTPNAQSCVDGSNCGPCTTLDIPSSVETVVGNNLYFKGAVPYASVKLTNQLIPFLKNKIANDNNQFTADELTAAKAILDQMEFESPVGVGALPPVVKLKRNVGTGFEEFHAVLWKMRRAGVTSGWSYMGIEVTNTTGATTTWTATSNYRAVVFAQDEDLRQRVSVKGLLEVEVAEVPNAVFMVRLFDSAGNKRNGAFPPRPPRASELVTFGNGGQGSFVAGGGQACCPNAMQPVYRYIHRRKRCR